MKTATPSKPTAHPPPASMGSEYMDAESYLKQPVRAPRVRSSDPTFHGSNESDFGSTPSPTAEST